MAAKYAIDGGVAGKERLDVLARVCAPSTTALLDAVGIREGARCLDVGCGGGHVSRELARRVGPTGSVLGLDLDAGVLELARADAAAEGLDHVEFRQANATEIEESGFDVGFARYLLSHLSDPGALVAAIAAAVRPGGVVVLEDINFPAYVCHPPSAAHDRWAEIYRETVRRRGGNADLGPELPRLLRRAGMESIGVRVAQACALEGEPKLIPPLTLERIADAAVAEDVAAIDEISQIAATLYEMAADPNTLMGAAPVVQAWGIKP